MPDTRTILILAGGAGTRLWPLSTEERPKQFLRIFEGDSLLQKTWRRLVHHAPADAMFVSTNEKYRALVTEQLPDLPPDNILVDPARRNTAPAIAACCATIQKRFPGGTVGIFPSDHWIGNVEAFNVTVREALDFASTSDHLVTIGLQPTEPNTGYGYLELAEPLSGNVSRLARFVEKPDIDRARQFVDVGNYLWNGGMFVWSFDVFFNALERAAPDVAKPALRFADEKNSDAARSIFEAMPSISIDYALMERADKVATVRAGFGWSDVGSWAAAARFMSPSIKAVHAEGTENVFAHSDSGRPVAVVGAKNLFVIDSPDGVLVLDASASEELSAVVKKIQGS